MRKLKSSTLVRYAVALLVGLGISLNVTAQNLGTLFTDLWWNPDESGWGVTISHQQNFLFLTFFIYQANGTPYWVTAQLQKVGTSGYPTFPQEFAGPVYQTSGPYFGGPFNPANVAGQVVGTASFSASGIAAGTLQYSINGVNVSKSIQRQTLVNVNYSGQYLGGLTYQTRDCGNPANNGLTVVNTGVVTISQVGTSLQAIAQSSSVTCQFNGTYIQAGSIGQTNGTYSCTDGTAGPFAFVGMQWTLFGMTAGVQGQSQFCSFGGYIGGLTAGGR